MKNIIVIILCLLANGIGQAQNTIQSYDYWFDNNFGAKVSTNIVPVEQFNLNSIISTAGLPAGLHVFNVRFKDDSARYSQVSSSFFYKQFQSGSPVQNDITDYEYWMDNDYGSKVAVSISPSQQFNLNSNIATLSTQPGLHVFHIRFRDQGGTWSQVLSQFFFKSVPTTLTQNDIVEYEFWYDNDYLSKVNTSISPQQDFNLVSNLATSSLPAGLHVMHIRFKDAGGKWSQVLSQFFNKTQASLATQKLITSYQYWFDNDFTNHVSQSIAPVSDYQLISSISTGTLPVGLHTFHIRFKDTNNVWSQALTSFVYKAEPQPTGNNAIVAYRYWTDNQINAATYVQLPTPLTSFNLNTDINMLNVPKGARVFNIQFKDTLQKWSVVQTDSFFRTPKPMASFTAGTTTFCDSGTVSFLNNSFDTDVYLWDFGDGFTSTDSTPVHTYTTPGTYTVSLVGTDTLMSLQDDTVQAAFVSVGTTPTVLATVTQDTLCIGQSTTFTGSGTATSFAWSGGVLNNQPFIPSASLMYYVTGTSGFCSADDSVFVTVHPLPAVTVSTINPNDTICDGTVLTLAGSGAVSYTWNGPQTISNNTPFAASLSGVYTVTGTDANLCSNTSSVSIMVNPIPVFSLGADTSICQGNSLVLSQPVTGASVLWNNGSVDDTLLVNNAGTYSCNLTLNGCSYADSIQVSIDSLPIANFGYSISNSTITLTDSSMYGTTYKWYFGDGDSSTLSAPTHIYATNGNYTVTQIVYNPCGTDTFKRTISIITGIIEQQISSIMIYPNPTSNVLNIDLKDQLKDHVSIYLIDMKGDLLYRKQFHQADQIIPIDVHDLPAGTYLLRVATGDQIFVQRVMISK